MGSARPRTKISIRLEWKIRKEVERTIINSVSGDVYNLGWDLIISPIHQQIGVGILDLVSEQIGFDRRRDG